MTFTDFLTSQLSDFVSVYKKYYRKTLGITSVLAFVSLLFIVVLLILNQSESESFGNNRSLLTYFFNRFSIVYSYNIADLSKIVFLFIASLFSLTLFRYDQPENENKEFNNHTFFNHLKASDVGYLFISLIACVVTDYLLFQADSFCYDNIENRPLNTWTHNIIYFLRTFVPLVFFSIANFRAITASTIHFKSLGFIIVVLWLFDGLAYEFYWFVKQQIFVLLLVPVPDEKYVIAESILEIPLAGFFFLGYHSALTNASMIIQKSDNEKIQSFPVLSED